MKSVPQCLVCMLQQALNTTRLVTDDEAVQKRVLARVAEVVRTCSLDPNPAFISKPVYDIVAEETGVADPYLAIKEATNREALRVLPRLEAMVDAAEDPLDAALHLAVAGNIIDLGIGHAFDIEKDAHAIMEQPFAIHDIDDFRAALRPGVRLLYLGDNSGEIVFDRVLVERLLQTGAEVTFVVKSGPIINDALMADACMAGLTGIVPVIETGSNQIGIGWEEASEAFKQTYETADVILGKGHGNFETGSGLFGDRYFLLKAKCEVVARELGVRKGAIVFKHARG